MTWQERKKFQQDHYRNSKREELDKNLVSVAFVVVVVVLLVVVVACFCFVLFLVISDKAWLWTTLNLFLYFCL